MYISAVLMRNDMDSMNAGKACAQSNHASDALRDHMDSLGEDHWVQKENYKDWKQGTPQGFGTVLVYAASGITIQQRVLRAVEVDLVAGLVDDTSYPIKDGKVTHHVPLFTCAYVFGPDWRVKAVLNNLELMP